MFVSEMRVDNGRSCEGNKKLKKGFRGWEYLKAETNNNYQGGYLIFSALQVR